MLSCGIDVGSRTTKAVVLGEGERVLARVLRRSGPDPAANSEAVYAEALKTAGLARDDVAAVVATGYGRRAVSFATRVVTEIVCHARGVCRLLPGTRTVIDIGGQDSKMIFLEADGMIRDFAMNERCAAGTGRFLEVLADIVHVPLEAMAETATRAVKPATISSTCAIFAESEVLGLLAAGASAADVVAGVHAALAKRVVALCHGVGAEPPIAFTGGVALDRGMAAALAAELGHDVTVPPDPQTTGALGAALIAARHPTLS